MTNVMKIVEPKIQGKVDLVHKISQSYDRYMMLILFYVIAAFGEFLTNYVDISLTSDGKHIHLLTSVINNQDKFYFVINQ